MKNPTAADLGVPGVEGLPFEERAQVFKQWVADARPTANAAWSMATDLLPERDWHLKRNEALNIGFLVAGEEKESVMWATLRLGNTDNSGNVLADAPAKPTRKKAPAKKAKAQTGMKVSAAKAKKAPAKKAPAKKKATTKKKGDK